MTSLNTFLEGSIRRTPCPIEIVDGSYGCISTYIDRMDFWKQKIPTYIQYTDFFSVWHQGVEQNR